MESVGHKLREARLRLDLTLEQVSADTRISLKNLTAIEADELSRISSPFFYRSFVRQFAAKVKLDYESIADDLQQAARTMPEPLVPGQEEVEVVRAFSMGRKVLSVGRKRPLNFKWLGSVASFCVVMAACTGMYTLWQQSHASWHDMLGQVGSRVLDLKTSVASGVASSPKAISPADNQQAPASDAQPANDAKAELKSAESEARSSAAPESDSSASTASESIDGGFHIELAAIEPSWLSIVADGKEIFSGMLDPSETKVLDGHQSARIRTGNAGGLSFTFNGKDLGVLGPRGQIRTVVFTRDNYKVLPSAPQVALTAFIPSGEQ
jgi:cytoskeletal protein RodZ